MTRHANWVAFSLLVASWGCGGSRSTDVSKDLDRGARLVLTITRQAPAGYLADAPADAKSAMEGQGYAFRDTEFDYPPLAMQGHFLQIGDQFLAVGVDGVFFIPKGMEVQDPTPVFNELSDAQPMGTVEVAPSLVASSEPLKTVVLHQQSGPIGEPEVMDGPPNELEPPLEDDDAGTPDDGELKTSRPIVEGHSHTSAEHLHGAGPAGTEVTADGCPRYDCNTTVNNASACCLDFDLAKGRIKGSIGSGGLSASCTLKRFWEYSGTVCDVWVKRDVCLREAATGLGPYGCYRTHRYRYCQFLDEKDYGIGVPATATVTVGNKLQIKVRNNTPANETLVTLTGDAKGNLPANAALGVVSLGAGQTRIDHYSEPKKKHYVERTLTYQAPASLPSGKTEAYDTLSFSFWGKTQAVTIRVVDRCKTKKKGSKALDEICG